jgi:hypothetical protein
MDGGDKLIAISPFQPQGRVLDLQKANVREF